MDQADSLRELMQKGRVNSSLRVVGLASGKGGVGKTNLTANLAVCLSRAGKRVLIIDADLGLANVEILFGLQPKLHLGHLLESNMSVEEVLAEGPHGIHVLPAGSGVQALTRLDDAQKLRLVTAIDHLEQAFDVILIDSGAGIGDNVLFFTGAAQETLLVLNPEPTALTDAYAAVKVLSQKALVKNFGVVVNQVPSDAHGRDVFQKLGLVTSRFLDARLRYLGWVPRDENVHRAVMAQRPLVDQFPHSPASVQMEAIAQALLEEPPPVQLDGGFKFLWSRLFQESRERPG